MNQNRVVVVGGARTPFVRARTVFQKLPASTLGGAVLRETVARSGIDPKLIAELYPLRLKAQTSPVKHSSMRGSHPQSPAPRSIVTAPRPRKQLRELPPKFKPDKLR